MWAVIFALGNVYNEKELQCKWKAEKGNSLHGFVSLIDSRVFVLTAKVASFGSSGQHQNTLSTMNYFTGNDDNGNSPMTITAVAMAAVAMAVVCGLYVKGPSSIQLCARLISESFHEAI